MPITRCQFQVNFVKYKIDDMHIHKSMDLVEENLIYHDNVVDSHNCRFPLF